MRAEFRIMVITTDGRDRFANIGMTLEHRLDLAELDSESPNLDLVIEASFEDQLAVLVCPNPIAGSVVADR